MVVVSKEGEEEFEDLNSTTFMQIEFRRREVRQLRFYSWSKESFAEEKKNVRRGGGGGDA